MSTASKQVISVTPILNRNQSALGANFNYFFGYQDNLDIN